MLHSCVKGINFVMKTYNLKTYPSPPSYNSNSMITNNVTMGKYKVVSLRTAHAGASSKA